MPDCPAGPRVGGGTEMRIKIYFRLMIFVAAFAILMLIMQDAHGEEKKYLQTSYLDDRKTVIYEYNPKGANNAKGFLRQSVLDPRKTVKYDKDGKELGFYRKSLLDSRKTNYYPVDEDD